MSPLSTKRTILYELWSLADAHHRDRREQLPVSEPIWRFARATVQALIITGLSVFFVLEDADPTLVASLALVIVAGAYGIDWAEVSLLELLSGPARREREARDRAQERSSPDQNSDDS